MTSRMRVGIVGTGAFGAQVHLPVLAAAADLEVAWISDRDDERSRLVAKAFGVPHAALPDDPAKLPDADAVLLTIPYGVRRPYYEALGRRGTPVYAEKPFARTVAEHDGYCACFLPHAIATGYKMRNTGAARMLREAVSTKLFGELQPAKVRFGWPGVATGGRYSSNLELAGGGVLFEVACHYLDLMTWVTGAQTINVDDGFMDREAGFDIHTECRGTMGTAGGDVGFDVLVTNLRHTAMTVSFTFARGTVTLNTWTDSIPRLQPHGSDASIELRGPHIDYPKSAAQMTHAHWQAFGRGIREGKVNESHAVESRVTTALIEALYALPDWSTQLREEPHQGDEAS